VQRIVRILISNTLPILLQVFCLIANVTHLDLNARGGSERLAIATMEALSQLEDVEIELSTFQRPNIIELQSAFGQSSVSVIKEARTMRILNRALLTIPNVITILIPVILITCNWLTIPSLTVIFQTWIEFFCICLFHVL
jgi:hypothetical protein